MSAAFDRDIMPTPLLSTCEKQKVEEFMCFSAK